jgi:flagellar basal body rod protein FlgB
MIDNELKEEGYDPSDQDFYNKVDEVLRQRYPQKFSDSTAETETPRLQDTSSNSAQVVAGASRTPKTSKAKNKVKLTQEDLRLADKWGISIEQYAVEKLKVEQADGDYTSI